MLDRFTSLPRFFLASACAAGVLAGSARLAVADEDEQPGAEFGLGGGARQIWLTRGVAEVFAETAPAGTRTEGYSVEFARRGKQLEFVLGFGYDNLNASNGYYLETGGDPANEQQVDFTEFESFEWFTIDATILGYLELHKILAIRYGAGLGVGIVRGEILRSDSRCTSDNLQRDCVPVPEMDSQQFRDPIDLPPAVPILHGLVGLQFRPIEAVAINIDAGLRTVPYLGASAMFYLW